MEEIIERAHSVSVWLSNASEKTYIVENFLGY